jgi:hypothetical protein
LRRWILLAGVVFAIVARDRLCMADTPAPAVTPLTVRLGPLPDLKVRPQLPISVNQARHTKALIASLANLDTPDFGLSSTLSGTAFAPLPGQEQVGTMMLTDHGLASSLPLKELITIGPNALPFLLDALDDQTPTKLVIAHPGAMWFENWLDMNPVNPVERPFYHDRIEDFRHRHTITSYTVKVGDVCFVAVGQIVGRHYQAVRYVPSGCVAIESPTHDPKLCAAVRAIWKLGEPRIGLFDSLCADYSTQGIFNGKSLDGWADGSESQCRAAMRLLFYFPDESTDMLAQRLDALDVSEDCSERIDDSMRRCVSNQVYSNYFIKGLSWSASPIIRKSMVGVFKRAGNIDDMLAALPGVDDKELVRHRLEALVAALPVADIEAYGDGYHLFANLVESAPDLAKPLVDEYLKDRSEARCFTIADALDVCQTSWDVDVLAPMLRDKRPSKWDFAAVSDHDEPRLMMRVCDQAALTLTQIHPELKFDLTGQYADIDKQIAAIRKTLSARKPPGSAPN